MNADLRQLRGRLDGLMTRDRHRLARRIERSATGRRPRVRSEADDLASLARDIEVAEGRLDLRRRTVPALSYPPELPISGRRQEIIEAIAANQVVVVAGETGSGKTTQLPKMCLELGRGVYGMIGHTQPRRIAARTVAERLAEELSVPLGEAVGYSVRFDDTIGDATLVRVMTDGLLLAEVGQDRLLHAYDTIIVDEAHERSLNIDFLLGYLTQILPKRPDLKVIITSATIDTARFAAHFDAPVLEVSGRTHPVEIRYRPLDGGEAGPDIDLNQAVCEAVSELVAEGPGDILVFLPGERDIRDAADALDANGPEGVEILPLFARLSAAEQHRVFKPHRQRRIVLATNVAETSLTVPGIRAVVDTGLARISRFNHRTKIQRLPIEPISRASADQRAGRCGRVAPGTCIRLYSEDDLQSRPEFTDPEILRTNLASVILQMAAVGLGDVETFPFLEPPDRRSVADGRALLEEVGAFERRDGAFHLTRTGRGLAELPLDPRLGRMVLEGERRGCLREITVIAAALSIQDPRERPADKAEEAAEFHRRFRVPDSDFLGYLRLWDYLAERQSALSGNQFRKLCRAEYLNVMRVREWQDVAGQIRRVHRSQGIHANREAAPAEQVHLALLTGLLSHIGMRDSERGDYRGARNARWRIGRESALARRQPAWAVAGALVETEGVWARNAAQIDPGWAETTAAHLVRHSHSDPWWDPKRGEAMAEERVTLYGLPIVTGRPVSLARLDPAAARQIFIQNGLVERDWSVHLPFLDRLAELQKQLRSLEDRVRSRNLYAGDQVLAEFYDGRLPPDVTSGSRFQRWWKKASRQDPQCLDIPLRALINPDAGRLTLADYPDRWVLNGIEIPLRYVYRPGEPDDGVTAVVALRVLNRMDPELFEWNVPGFRPELVTSLVRLLPKVVRRSLGPAPEVARQVLEGAGPAEGPLLGVVAQRLSRLVGEPVDAEAWDPDALPPHLRMTIEVIDEEGRVLARGHDLELLREALADQLRATVGALAPELIHRGATAWEFGDLPRRVERGDIVAYPALVDQGESVGVSLFDTAAAQADNMWRGSRRLLMLVAPVPFTHLQRTLSNETKLAIVAADVTMHDLLTDCAGAVVEAVLVDHGGPAFSQADFEAMAGELRRDLAERTRRLAVIAGGVLAAAQIVAAKASRLEAGDRSRALAPALADVRRQMRGLVFPGFVTVAGTGRLSRLLRYLEASQRRLDRLPADLRRDAVRQATIERVTTRYEHLLGQVMAGTASSEVAARAAEVRWMIEELRVSLWAQDLGTPTPVSEERILRMVDRSDV